MRGISGNRWGAANWISGLITIVTLLALNFFAPELDRRWRLLIALGVGIASGVLISLFGKEEKVKKKAGEADEEDILPPLR